jgi:hypothetical protein
MIYLLTEKVTSQQVHEMLAKYPEMIKIVVDIRRAMLAGGSDMHYECEELLLDQGSEQDDLWGANWFPEKQAVEFESLINIRPRLGNRGMIIQSDEIRQKVEAITRRILGDVL